MKKAAIFIFGLLVIAVCGLAQADVAPRGEPKPQWEDEFQQSLKELVAYSPDACGGREQDWHTANIEAELFDHAADIVAEGLNAAPSNLGLPRDRATETLKRLEKMSAETNVSWPEENRFHFQVLDLSPALIVKMSVRSRETFFVFGVPEEEHGKASRVWRRVGSEDASVSHDVPHVGLGLFPLHRGPSGNVRFLARFDYSGCAGGTGVAYYGHEWNSHGTGAFQLMIKQAGAFGLDDKVPGFPEIGELRTEGALITLPYCWFSAIDTWDHPSLCAVDTYDLSGDSVRFRSRTYNRPDLVPIAKAVEYAENRDYGAVRGYCASAEVARSLVRDIPPFVFGEDLRVTPTGPGKERVETGSGYWFDVEKVDGRWLVVAFKAKGDSCKK